jgi:hypothetical protein
MIKILLASCVRQKEEVFKLFYKSLENLLLPANVQMTRLFILHNSSNLKQFIHKTDFVQIVETSDEYKTDETTHYWKGENLYNITHMKNSIFDFVKNADLDYVFIVDSDLILHPETLVNLLKTKKQIVSEIFWTKWNKHDRHEMPNAWDIDHYRFYEGTVEKYKEKGLYECGGTGACILIHRSVIEAGVNFNPVTNVSFWGEDRAFQIRANVAGFKLWVDTNSPAFHVYRDSYIDDGKKFLDKIINKG